MSKVQTLTTTVVIRALWPDGAAADTADRLRQAGFEIVSLADDGTAAVRARGGMYLSVYEGHPLLVHGTDAGAFSEGGAIDALVRVIVALVREN